MLRPNSILIKVAMSARLISCCAVVLSLATGLSACGGSGGGGGSSPASAPPATPMAFTQANADASAGEAYRAAYGSTDVSSVGPGFVSVLDANSAAPAVEPDNGAPLRLVFNALQRSLELKAAQAEVLSERVSPLATQTNTVACNGGGTLSITLTYTSTILVLPGDIVSATFNNCRAGGTLIAGVFSVSVSSVVGYVSQGVYPWTANLAASYANLRVLASATGNGVSVNGSMSMSAQFINATDFTTSISSSSFSSSWIAASGPAFATQTVTNYNSTYEYATAMFGLTTSATLARDLSTGRRSFSIATPLKFTGVPGEFPSVGQMILTGANSSKVRLTAVDAINARIEVDANGDGVYESSNLRAWSSFYGLTLS
jgi:hypothetical protein